MLYTFLDEVVWTAYKHPHLPYEKLPALADYDRSTYLKATSFPILDPSLQPKPRYLFWSLMDYFRMSTSHHVVLVIYSGPDVCFEAGSTCGWYLP